MADILYFWDTTVVPSSECVCRTRHKFQVIVFHGGVCALLSTFSLSLPLCARQHPLDNIRVMVIVWRLRGNIIRTALCWIVWHNVHSQQHTYISSSYRSNRLGLSHWDSYAVCRGGCLELYYCNMVEWFWWDSSLISTTNWFPSVLWHCWFGHLASKNRPWNDLLCVEWDVKPYTDCHYSTQWLVSLPRCQCQVYRQTGQIVCHNELSVTYSNTERSVATAATNASYLLSTVYD